MGDLANLLERVTAAAGPDRELGRSVLLALGWSRTVVGHFYGPLYWWTAPQGVPAILSGDDDRLPDVTASLDAALALVERKLPGWGFYLRRDKDGCGAGLVYPEHSFVTPGLDGATPALALLAALLRALIAEEAAAAPTARTETGADLGPGSTNHD